MMAAMTALTESDFAALHSTHHRMSIRLAAKVVGPEHAEDVVQAAWVKAWAHRDQFRGDCALSSWWYRVVSNTALSWYRSESKRGLGRIDPIEAAMDVPAITTPSPFDQALRMERRRLLVLAMRQLPAEIREAVHRADLDSLTHREAAARSGVKEETHKSRLHRGRQRLHRLVLDSRSREEGCNER